MVMHPSPGHYSGTLVNALLHHCQLPAMQLGKGAAAPLSLEGAAAVAAAAEGDGSSCDDSSSGGGGGGGGGGDTQLPAAVEQQQGAAVGSSSFGSASLESSEQSELEEEDEEEGGFQLLPAGTAGTADGTVRPGIVHRLDKGTTGLLVVAKTDAAHLSLAQQVCKGSVGCTCLFGQQLLLRGRATNAGRQTGSCHGMACVQLGVLGGLIGNRIVLHCCAALSQPAVLPCHSRVLCLRKHHHPRGSCVEPYCFPCSSRTGQSAAATWQSR